MNAYLQSYYKRFNNLSLFEIKDDSTYPFTNYHDEIYLNGKGDAYGIEMFQQIDFETIKIVNSYTLSWTTRQFQELNEGQPFLYNYDRRHDIRNSLIYEKSERLNFSLSSTFYTGARITAPIGQIRTPTNTFFIYDGINNASLPNYWRIDCGMNWIKKTKYGSVEIDASIYNLLNRKNPNRLTSETDVKFDTNGQPTEIITYYQIASYFPLTPGFNILFNF